MVVPAGEQTSSFSCPGCFPVSSTILALPSTACAAILMASGRRMPSRTAASAIASISMKIYAGLLPLTAMKPSNNFSSMTAVSPIASKIPCAYAKSAAESVVWRQIAVMPAPTSAGVFGITRSSVAVVPATLLVSMSIVQPAAIDTSARSLISPLMLSSSSPSTCGFTASTIIRHSCASALASVVQVSPGISAASA